MGIVGNRPETGLRVTLRRLATAVGNAAEEGAHTRAVYDGEIVASDGSRERFLATVRSEGAVSVTPSAAGTVTDANAKRATLLLRTIVRECERDGRAQLPAKIVRWWGEK